MRTSQIQATDLLPDLQSGTLHNHPYKLTRIILPSFHQVLIREEAHQSQELYFQSIQVLLKNFVQSLSGSPWSFGQ